MLERPIGPVRKATILGLLASLACTPVWSQTAKPDLTCSPGNLQQVQPEVAQEVSQFLLALQSAVKSNDKDAAAQLFNYPFAVHLKNGRFNVRTPEDFVKKYDRIFPKELVNVISSQKVECINQVGSKGFMLDRGEIWFDKFPNGKMQPSRST